MSTPEIIALRNKINNVKVLTDEEDGGLTRSLSNSLIQNWNRLMSELDHIAWYNRIGVIKDIKIRSKVSSLIWWDFLASNNSENKENALMEFITQWRMNDDVPFFLIKKELVKLGYYDKLADKRSYHEEDVEPEDESEE